MKQKGVRTAMIAGVCLCLALAAITACLINAEYVQSIKRLVRRTTAASISELTVSKAQYLDEKIRSERLSLQSLAAILGAGGDLFSYGDFVMDYQNRHDVSRMWILDRSGNVWSTGQGTDPALPSGAKELFADALAGKSTVSDAVIGMMGKRQLLLQTPIRRDGKVVGGLYEAYPMESLQNTCGGSTYNDAGYSYVLDKDGRVVIAPVRFSDLQIYDYFQDVLKDSNNNPAAVSDFIAALQSGARGTATFDFERETQFLSFTPLEEKSGWYFVTVIPLRMVERDGMEIVRLTVRMASVTLLVVVLVLALALTALYFRSRKRRMDDLYLRNIYHAISQNIDTVIFIVNGQTFAVEHAFENAQKVLGFPAQDFYGTGGAEKGQFLNALFVLFRERPSRKAMWELSIFNDRLGRQMWLKVTALPVTLHGAPKYIFAATDVTMDRQIRENLNAAVAAAEQANAAKSQFLSNMSHDIRTPMNAIVGMTKLAEIHIEDRGRVEDCLHKISISSKHLLNLINDVLDMSKIESGKMTLAAEPFSLPEMVEDNLAIVRPQCRSKGQSFSVETKDIRHERLVGDPLRLNQVFLNLMSNAVKFTPVSGTVSFLIRELPQKHPGYAVYRFQVSDDGIGIAPEFLSTVFTPFERERTQTVAKTEGTGLGLAIAKNIVEAMGGQIFVESRLNEGSTFTVDLELKLQPGAEDDSTAAKSLEGLRALIVDDSPDDLELLQTYLIGFGMTVDTAAAGDGAMEAFGRGKQYDLVLLDWKLPGMDGVQTARRIRALAGSDAEIVLITAYDWSAVENDVGSQGVKVILQKPIFKSTLCQKLSRLFSAQSAPAPETAPRNVLRGKRILLVEDNELNREIACELFSLSGAAVETAADGKEGVEAFEQKEAGYYDVIFMDIQMPVMNGYEAAGRIRASGHPQGQSIPIVAMSANVFAEDVRSAQEAGMNAHTAKPMDMGEICRILSDLLEPV